MFYEGSEKKAEIIIDTKQVSLLTYSDEFWEAVVAQSDAKILSKISNDEVKAFILSESSLFVWNDRLLLLTCGNTRLVSSVMYFLAQVDKSAILQLIYQRKNEYCSHLQHSHATVDTKQLQTLNDGKLMRFGELDSHHSYLYHLDNDYTCSASDKTYEVLIYNIDKKISSLLSQCNIEKSKVRDLLQLDKLIPGFDLDDVVFEPIGYSLNAIRGRDYFTVHLTPQAKSSYVSFESNLNLIDIIPTILSIFSPSSIDVVTFNENGFEAKIMEAIPLDYKANELVEERLSCSYMVHFGSFSRENKVFTKSTNISLEGVCDVF